MSMLSVVSAWSYAEAPAPRHLRLLSGAWNSPSQQHCFCTCGVRPPFGDHFYDCGVRPPCGVRLYLPVASASIVAFAPIYSMNTFPWLYKALYVNIVGRYRLLVSFSMCMYPSNHRHNYTIYTDNITLCGKNLCGRSPISSSVISVLSLIVLAPPFCCVVLAHGLLTVERAVNSAVVA